MKIFYKLKKFVNNLSVGQKVLSLIIVELLSYSVVTSIALTQIHYVGDEVKNLSNLLLPLISEAQTLHQHRQEQNLNFQQILNVGERVVYDKDAEDVFKQSGTQYWLSNATILRQLDRAQKLIKQSVAESLREDSSLQQHSEPLLQQIAVIRTANKVRNIEVAKIFQHVEDGSFLMGLELVGLVLENEQALTKAVDQLIQEVLYLKQRSVSYAESVEDRASTFTILAALITIFVGVSIIFLIVKFNISKPLHQLTATIEAFNALEAMQESPAEQQLMHRGDELGMVSRSFNDLKKELHKTTSELLSYQENLEQKVTQRTVELEQTNSKLEVAIKATEEANKAKSLFLANMSHELRTPLNAILGFSQLMERDSAITQLQQENLGIIARSGEHLLSLVNDVLEMSKIEAGRITIDKSGFELHQTLNDIGEMMRIKAEDKNLLFTLENDSKLVNYVKTDLSKLRQILINLIGNAIKYTEEGGIVLRTKSSNLEEPNMVRLQFQIEDSGVGIAPQELDTIFDAFMQASTRGNVEGTGLGLAITRKHVQLLGSDITIKSEIGVGSLFQFDIVAEVVDKADIVALSKNKRRIIALEDGQPDYRILIVEDKVENRLLLKKLLQSIGMNVQEAVNGQEAIEVFQTWQPHLIWMDMRMPVMDGLEATKRILSLTQKSEIQPKIIALTASAFEDEKESIVAAGCTDFVRKPFKEASIFNMMSRHLGVRYTYDDEEEVAEVVDSPETSTDIPTDLLANLEKAAKSLNINLIDSVIKQIEERNATLGASLSAFAKEFRYDKILQKIEQLAN